jgi:ribonucleoside-diphosphate reductase alpha chain
VAVTQVGIGERVGIGLSGSIEGLEHAVARCGDLPGVDALRVVRKTVRGLHEGADLAQVVRLAVQGAAELIGEEPQYRSSPRGCCPA